MSDRCEVCGAIISDLPPYTLTHRTNQRFHRGALEYDADERHYCSLACVRGGVETGDADA